MLAAHWTCEYQRGRLRASIEGLAPTYAIELEHAGHAAISVEEGPDSPLYRRLIQRQKEWLAANKAVADIYTIRKRPDGELFFVVDSETDYDHDGLFQGSIETRTPIGELFPDAPMRMHEAFLGKTIFDDIPVTDRWGTWVGTYVPMRNAEGQVEAILGVDFPAAGLADGSGPESRRVLGVSLALIAGLQVGIFNWYQHRSEIRRQHDIVAQKHAHAQALEDAIRRLRAYEFVIDTHACLAITDHRGILTHVNDRFCQLSGFEWEELIGEHRRC